MKPYIYVRLRFVRISASWQCSHDSKVPEIAKKSLLQSLHQEGYRILILMTVGSDNWKQLTCQFQTY